MIWALAREQVRSQRRYLMWAAAVISLAVGIATYGGLLGHELKQAEDATNHALVLDTDHAMWNTFAVDSSSAPSVTNIDAMNTALDSAGDIRHAAQATMWSIRIEPNRDSGLITHPLFTTGDLDWDAILIEGAPPATGQVALSKAAAERMGVGVGDTVPVYVDVDGLAPAGIDPTVSGITRSPVAGSGLWLPTLADYWLPWEDLEVYGERVADIGGGSSNATADVTFTWDGSSPELAKLAAETGASEYSAVQYGQSDATLWVILGVTVLAVGSIAMAFAFGRAQAQSRTQWVATARALGATRRHVVLATMFEAGILALSSLVAGYLLGTLAATAHLVVVHIATPGAGIAAYASFAPLVALGALVLALAMSFVVAGVPAFWATRVSPAAALKPENDVTNAQVSRNVRFWPVATVWATFGLVALLSADRQDATGGPLLAVLSRWGFALLSFVVANETLRWLLPVAGRWLSRRPEKTALLAGDSMCARPRQYSVPALLWALGTSALLTLSVVVVLQRLTLVGAGDGYGLATLVDETWPSWILPATIIILSAFGLLSTAIAVATAAVTQRERATREALGITARQSRAAAGLAHFVSLLLGTIVGVLGAAAVTTVFAAAMQVGDLSEPLRWDIAFWLAPRAIGIVLGVGLLFSVVSALVVAAAARTPSVPGLPAASTKAHA